MKMKKQTGLAVLAGAGSCAGYAAVRWLRYGHGEHTGYATLLDRYMHEAEVVERHEIEVNAPADVAYAAACNIDLVDSRLARMIFGARAILMRSSSKIPALPKPIVEQMKVLGWAVLDETPGREIVFGAAAKPWKADVGFRTIAPPEFAAFAEPGWAKIVWNLLVDPVREGRCIVRTETRVTTTDPESRRRFRVYWSLASLGIVLIRLIALKMVKAEAEGKRRAS